MIIGFTDGLKPEPRLTLTEWSDKHRILDSKAAAEPGPYRSSRTPYWVEVMNHLSTTNIIRKVIIMKAAQVGATEIGLNFIGYTIDLVPAPFLAVMPTLATMERNSKMRIAPMIESSPRLRTKVKSSRSKDSGNTITQKEYPGGVLLLAGANSGAGLRSMPVRFLMLDEVDGYPQDVDGEGSPSGLAEQRTATFPNKKILILSTPTISGQSAIEADFNTTDQRYYFVPCPHCACEQILKFEQLRWNSEKWEDTEYECIHCNERIQERYKTKMLSDGRWIATAPKNENRFVVGYHINALYSPAGWKSWAEIAEQWDKSQGDDNKLKLFTNTVLGETWKEKTEAPAWEILQQRSESYEANKPFTDVAFLTAGIDVQADRVEIEIVGWMQGKKSQSIDYRVLIGDTTKKEVWLELDKIINETWVRQDDAQLGIRLAAIDSGYNTSIVYDWCKKHTYAKVIAIKGSESLDNYFSPPRVLDSQKHGKKIGKHKVWIIGSSFIKSETYGFLRQSRDQDTSITPAGYCYFPSRDTHYFRSLTAEAIQTIRSKRGYIQNVWVKLYARNEALDCRVYARAAAAVVGMDRWTESRWQQEIDLIRPTKQVRTKKKETKSSIWKK